MATAVDTDVSQLSFEAAPNGGSALRVVIPLAGVDRQPLERAA